MKLRLNRQGGSSKIILVNAIALSDHVLSFLGLETRRI